MKQAKTITKLWLANLVVCVPVITLFVILYKLEYFSRNNYLLWGILAAVLIGTNLIVKTIWERVL